MKDLVAAAKITVGGNQGFGRSLPLNALPQHVLTTFDR
jgi:hypothetical protein